MKRLILLPALFLLATASQASVDSEQEHHLLKQIIDAIKVGNGQIAIELLEANKWLAGKNLNDRYSPATMAAYWGDTAVLGCIHRLDPNLLTQADGNKHTPATTAVLFGNTTVLEYLHRLEPNLLKQADSNKLTPATTAASCGQTDVLKYLKEELGVDLTQSDADGCTPTTRAVYAKQIAVLKYLKEELGVDLNQEDGNGRTAREIAERLGNHETLDLLTRLENGEGSNGDPEEARELTPSILSNALQVDVSREAPATPPVRTPEKPVTPSGGSASYVVIGGLLFVVVGALVVGLSLQGEDETPEPQLQEDERSPNTMEEERT